MPISRPKELLRNRIRISKKKFSLIVKCFSLDLTSSQTAKLTCVNRNTTNRFYFYFRKLLLSSAILERKNEKIANGIEIDESYFGPRRQRGKRGRGASHKIVVFGLLKRKGNVYTNIIPDAKKDTVMPIIRRVVKSGADIFTDGWRSYDALAVYGYNHKKVHHERNEFVRGKDIHVNGIESFWSYAKRRLNKFNGIPKKLFSAYLLETEWRFNHRNDILKTMRKLIRRNLITRDL